MKMIEDNIKRVYEGTFEIEVFIGSHLDDLGDWTNIAELAGKGLNVLSGYLTTEKVRHFCCDHPLWESSS